MPGAAGGGKRLERLKKRADFLRAQRGRRAASRSVVVQFIEYDTPAAGGRIRVGFTATRKIGGAVVRNRAKRRLRALADQLLPDLGRTGGLYVFIARQDTATRPHERLRADLRSALHRVHEGGDGGKPSRGVPAEGSGSDGSQTAPR